MAEQYGATVAKRRLARQLTELRTKNGYTANQVCDRLNWGRGKVGRFEANLWRRPELSDIRDLMRLYQVEGADAEEFERLAVLARQRAWWREYGDVFGESEYPGFEADAARISVYMPLILPGLVQTVAYTEVHMAVGTRPEPWRERALQARRRRQEVLARTGGAAPHLRAVVTEASLLYQWGTREQRREQVRHLIELGTRADVEIRLLPFAGGPHPGMSSLISLFDFPGDEPPIAYLENDAVIQEVNDIAEVQRYAAIFGSIREAALDAAATRAHLGRLVETLE